MAADDSLYAGEAETGPPTDFFGREEGIEYPRLHSGLDADAVVPHDCYLHRRVAESAGVGAATVSFQGDGLESTPSHRPVESGFIE